MLTGFIFFQLVPSHTHVSFKVSPAPPDPPKSTTCFRAASYAIACPKIFPKALAPVALRPIRTVPYPCVAIKDICPLPRQGGRRISSHECPWGVHRAAALAVVASEQHNFPARTVIGHGSMIPRLRPRCRCFVFPISCTPDPGIVEEGSLATPFGPIVDAAEQNELVSCGVVGDCRELAAICSAVSHRPLARSLVAATPRAKAPITKL